MAASHPKPAEAVPPPEDAATAAAAAATEEEEDEWGKVNKRAYLISPLPYNCCFLLVPIGGTRLEL